MLAALFTPPIACTNQPAALAMIRARTDPERGRAAVELTKIPTPPVARPRALSVVGAPIAQRTGVSAWRVTSAAPAASYMRSDLVRCTTLHNSIRTTDVVVPVPAGRGFGAAKQAAPPRGVPR